MVVAKERIGTGGRVFVAGGVAKERIKHRWPCCCAAGGVVKECFNTVGRVVGAGGVESERITTVGRVVGAGGSHNAVL